jgi:hypothetical protein
MSTEASALAPEQPAGEDDYQAFYAVLAGTARGRAFLDEHARRMRHAETEVLLAALKRLENQVAAQTPAPAPALPAIADLGALLETVRSARAQIDAVQLSTTVTQLVSTLETVQRRLSALLSAEPAPVEQAPAPAPIQPPFALAITAVAAQALAAAEPEEETVRVIKAGSMPPPPVFEGEDFSAGSQDLSFAEPALEDAQDELEGEETVAPSPAIPEEDPLAPLMALSEEERLALFS